LSAEILNDSLFVCENLGIGNFFLPLDVFLSQEGVFSLEGTEGTLQSDESITCTVNFSKSMGNFFYLEVSDVDTKGRSDLVQSEEESSQLGGN